MSIYFKIVFLLFPIVLFAQGPKFDDTPKEYVNHIVNLWDVDSDKIVYITDKTTLSDLSSIMHNSILSFVKGKQSTSAEILDGRRQVDSTACGLALNNLELDNVKKHLKEGKDYTKMHLKKAADNTPYEFSDKLTTILIYSKKLDGFLGDYFTILRDFNKKGVDYVIIIFDNEINNQIPGALKN